MEDGKRHSFHQPMRVAIESIKALYELSAIEMHDDKAKEVIHRNNSSKNTPLTEGDFGADIRIRPSDRSPAASRRARNAGKSRRSQSKRTRHPAVKWSLRRTAMPGKARRPIPKNPLKPQRMSRPQRVENPPVR